MSQQRKLVITLPPAGFKRLEAYANNLNVTPATAAKILVSAAINDNLQDTPPPFTQKTAKSA